MNAQELIVVGSGFAGMWAALVAARENAIADGSIHITVVTPEPCLTVRPRLYEPFTPEMQAPLGEQFETLGIAVHQGSATGIDAGQRALQVLNAGGSTTVLHYDRLVLAAGSVQRPLDVPGADPHAFDIDTFAGAARLHAHLESLDRLAYDDPVRHGFVIIGAGFTGVEMALEVRRRLRALGQSAAADEARIVLVERSNSVGPELGDLPRPHIEQALHDARVELRLGAEVSAIHSAGVELRDGERIAAATVVATTGLQAHALTSTLGVPTGADGRLPVDAQLRVLGAPGLYAAGDLAAAHVDATHLALMSCQHAVPMGKCAGYNAARDLLGLPPRAYSQPDYVTCLDLGDYGALFTTGWERRPEQVGADVKPLKQTINTQWIYPPGGDRSTLLTAADIDAPWPPT